MTIGEAQAFGYAQLRQNSPSAQLDCDLLLQHAVGKYAHFCVAHPEYILTETEEHVFREHIAKRLLHMPIAYILQTKEFYGRDFFVNEHVLIPRPETEGLIDLVLNMLKDTTRPWRILDLCTGSGCIAITLRLALPNSIVFASDISQPALDVAQKNADAHFAPITFFKGDLFEAIVKNNTKHAFDLIVCNPPYVPISHYQESIPETRGLAFEPRIALIPNEHSETGTEIIERVLRNAESYMTTLGRLALEISDNHAYMVETCARETFPKKDITLHNDLSGRPRYLLVQ